MSVPQKRAHASAQRPSDVVSFLGLPTWNRYLHTRKNLDDIYLFKFNNENTRTMCEVCSKLTIKTPERRH